MSKSNIQWIAVDVRGRDYFRCNGEARELEAVVRGSIPLGVDIINLTGEHENLNRLLSGHGPMQLKKVIFNPPATIVLWEDGDKTVVKIQNNETYDPEKGLAMAIAKKALGNEGNYFNHIKKWVDQYREEQEETRVETVTVEKKELKHPIYIKHNPVHGTILVEFGSRKDAEDCLEALNELCNVYGSCDVGDLYNLCAVLIGDDPLGGENYTHGWTSMKGVEVCELLDSLNTVYAIELPKPTPLK